MLIHAQSRDSGPPYRSYALHTSRVLYPHEMISPALCAWIKQGHCCTRGRIWGRGGRGFAEIAGGTGQAQILGRVATVRINMLNVQRLADYVPARLAVFAAIPCAFVD